MNWFEVDREGLAQVAARNGYAGFVRELIQNAWDAPGVATVEVTVEPVPGVPKARVRVADDSPAGFADISHAWRMFAPSQKKHDPELRGRFNLGEKLFLAVCDEAEIVSTTAAVRFDRDGRRLLRKRTQTGSTVDATMRVTRDELTAAVTELGLLIPPDGVATVINGREVPRRAAVAVAERVTLPTQIADEHGTLRQTRRQTTIRMYEPADNETAHIFELGIPVCENSTGWHIDVAQTVPLNLDRDNVTPGYRRALHAAVLEATVDRLDPDTAAAGWVAEGIEQADEPTVAAAVGARFGGDAVVRDPSAVESNIVAQAEGVTVIPPGAFTSGQWAAVRRARERVPGFAQPAGQAFPVGVETSLDGVPPVPEPDWTPVMVHAAAYARNLADGLGVGMSLVEFWDNPNLGWAGIWGNSRLGVNVAAHPYLRAGPLDRERFDALLLHEFAHAVASNHFSHEFINELARLGAAARSIPHTEQIGDDRMYSRQT